MALGQSIRPYLKTKMPGFGSETAETLAALFERVDRAEPREFTDEPKERKARQAQRDAGRKLVGTDGMGCVTCHTFAGQKVGAMGAVDVAESTTQRLRREWFYRYMLDPPAFRPDTLMPSFFPNGGSSRPDLLDGDAERQLDALWAYLRGGRNARAPKGLQRQPIELKVGDEAVILRRSAQGIGKRAINVGLPLGVHYAFDSESLALVRVWWGGFVDAAPVWTGQGSGGVRSLSRERFELPVGLPSFARLEDAAASPWPESSRRDLPMRFLGYDLDAQRRPTLRYTFDGVTIEDQCLDVRGEAERPLLRRTLRLSAQAAGTVYFRVAFGAKLQEVEPRVVRVGGQTDLRIGGDHPYRIRAGADGSGGQECVVELSVLGGENSASLSIDYLWRGDSK